MATKFQKSGEDYIAYNTITRRVVDIVRIHEYNLLGKEKVRYRVDVSGKTVDSILTLPEAKKVATREARKPLEEVKPLELVLWSDESERWEILNRNDGAILVRFRDEVVIEYTKINSDWVSYTRMDEEIPDHVNRELAKILEGK